MARIPNGKPKRSKQQSSSIVDKVMMRKAVQEEVNQRWAKIEFCFYFLCLIALKEEFGFGEERLKRFYTKMQALLTGVNWQIDSGFSEFVVDQLLRRLKKNKIDYENILDIQVLQVPDDLKGGENNESD